MKYEKEITTTVQFKGRPYSVGLTISRTTDYREYRKPLFLGVDNDSYPCTEGDISPEGMFGISQPRRAENDPEFVNEIWKAYNKMELLCKGACLALAFGNDAIREALAGVGVRSAADLKFSRKAGCRCGCSPGYRASGGARGRNVWVTVKPVRALALAA